MNATINEIIEAVKARVGADTEVSAQIVMKQGGVNLTGILIKEENSVIPTVYVDEMIQRGMSADEIAEKVIEINNKHKNVSLDEFGIQPSDLTEWEAIKDKLRYRLVNKETSTEFLKNKVWEEYLDMAIVPYVLLGGENKASVTVTNNLMNAWDKSADEVIEKAKNNVLSKEDEEAYIKDMLSIMLELAPMIDEEMMIPVDDTPETIIISNNAKTQGAIYGFIPSVLKKVADMLQSNLAILPSSVHECIVVGIKADDDIDVLRSMVIDVNATQVVPEERLSNSVYKFDRETMKIEIA